MKKSEFVGDNFHDFANKWRGCAIGNDGCLYAVPTSFGRYRHILKINPSNDSTKLVGPELERWIGWNGCIAGPDAYIYGIPCPESENKISKYDPITQELTMIGATTPGPGRNYCLAAVEANSSVIYFISKPGAILCHDSISQINSLLIGNSKQGRGQYFRGAVLAGDGCIYLIPYSSKSVMKFNPRDQSRTSIGDRFNGRSKWCGAVLGPDGNVYGIPCHHNYVLKVDVATQTTSLVGPDLGEKEFKYGGGVLGQDKCIYMIPNLTEFILKFNPITGVTSTVGESLDYAYYCKYSGGMLASNGFIYLIPGTAKQVLKVKSWDNWLYLKPRLLVEQRRAEGRSIQPDNDLSIVQHFIIHSIDDIFRTVLEMM